MCYKNHKLLARSFRRAFTLVELAGSIIILGILLGGVMIAYSGVTDTVARQALRERAVGVAQRRMELLLGSRREPNSTDMHGQDDLDPAFDWQLQLSRQAAGSESARADLSNTIIKAVVTVFFGDPELGQEPLVELVRYFEALKPIPGHALAVPLTPHIKEDPAWYMDLRARLGREPTVDEAMLEMLRIGDLPADMAAELGIIPDPNEILPEQLMPKP